MKVEHSFPISPEALQLIREAVEGTMVALNKLGRTELPPLNSKVPPPPAWAGNISKQRRPRR